MTKLYTGKGDDGTTGILGRKRVRKSELRMEVIGTLDELSANLGFVKSLVSEKAVREAVEQVQHDLYKMMSEIVAESPVNAKINPFPDERTTFLEKWLATWEQEIVLPSEFILPGETTLSAAFSVCRTVARRAERRLVELSGTTGKVNPEILRYMNRLSSLLFALEIKHSKRGSKQKLKFARI